MSNDLEQLLRRTLDNRAGDVTTGPQWQQPTRSPRRWIATLSAAAAVAAVAVAVVLIPRGHDPQAPPQTRPPTPVRTSAPVPPPQPSHVQRKAALSWFGMKELPGYALHERLSMPGYRVLAVRRDDDTGIPDGCNGCESATDYIQVFDAHRFDAAARGVPGWERVEVSGVSGYLGVFDSYRGHDSVHALVWEYRPDAWAVVYGVTDLGRTPDVLRTVADAVEPTVSVPIEVPYSFGYLPDLPVTSVTDDTSEGYAFVIAFGATGGRTFDMTIWPNDPRTVRHTAANRRLIGGLTGYYDPTQLVADVPLHTGFAEFGLSVAEDQSPTAADRAEMDQVVAAIRWSNGDGRAPYFTAEQAIP